MKWYHVVLIVFIIISLFTLYKAVVPTHYTKQEISFDYPGTWTEKAQNSHHSTGATSNVVTIIDPDSSDNTVVLVQKSKKSGTLDEIINASKAELKKDWNIQILSESNLTVDGQPAHDLVYLVNINNIQKKTRMVIFDKNNMVYCIILGCASPAFDGQKNNFDIIVKSFKVTG